VRELVARISELGGSTETRAFRITLGTEWLMRRAMANEALRTQLFRFVDALPAMADDADLYRHVEEYFGSDVLPGLFERGLAGSARVPGGRRLVAKTARREVARMATQFIVATDAGPQLPSSRSSGAAAALPPLIFLASTPILTPRRTGTPPASPSSSLC